VHLFASTASELHRPTLDSHQLVAENVWRFRVGGDAATLCDHSLDVLLKVTHNQDTPTAWTVLTSSPLSQKLFPMHMCAVI
jgi:hypothetical protein